MTNIIIKFFDDLWLKKDVEITYDVLFYRENNIKGYHRKNINFREELLI